MKFLNIRSKLYILILIILIPLVVLQVIRIQANYNEKVECELRSQQDFVEAISTSFLNYLEGIWSQEQSLGRLLAINQEINPDDMKFYLSDLSDKDKTNIGFVWINSSGHAISNINSQIDSKAFLEHRYIQRIMNGEEKTVSDLDVGLIKGTPTLLVARGVKSKEGKLNGILIAVIDVAKLNLTFPVSKIDKSTVYGLIDRNGIIVYRSGNNILPIEKRRITSDSPAWYALKGETYKVFNRVSPIDNIPKVGINCPIPTLNWACYVSSPIAVVLGKHYQQTVEDIIIFAIITLISLISAYFLGNFILKPLYNLKNTANKINTGDFSARTNIDGHDEIAATAKAFDHMAEGIEQYDKLKSQFFSNLSHELKTPINVIFASTQLISNSETSISADEYQNKVNRHTKVVKQNCYRLIRLVNNLIDITRYESGFLQMNIGNHNIVQIVEDITLSIVQFAKTKGIELLFDTDVEEKYIACDPDMIERIMLNLLSNALKFTNPEGKIIINVFDRSNSLIISVKDTGIGISKEKIDLVFERFRQVDESLNRNHEGSGIGLSLVKTLVEAHGGTASVKSEYGVGSEFIIELPARTIDNKDQLETEISNGKAQGTIEKINIEFSDIYSFDDQKTS